MTKLNDIITNESDELYVETALWCRSNHAMLQEIEPIEKEVEEEYIEQIPVENDSDDPLSETQEVTKTRLVKKIFRRFKVVAIPDPSIEEQNNFIRLQRQSRFAAEADPLKFDYEEALALGDESAEEKKQLWLAKKKQIREELPYLPNESGEVIEDEE